MNTSNFAEFIKLLRENFWAEINVKTGWGNQELKLAFERAVSNTLASFAMRHEGGNGR